jgi:hypothetical protein
LHKKVLIVLICLAPVRLLADESEPRVLIGMAGDVLVPSGQSLKDLYNTGFGVSITGQYEFNRHLATTVTASYVSFPADPPEGISFEDGSMLPIVAGVKVCMPAGDVRFFLALDAGMTRVHRWVPGGGVQPAVPSSTVEFVWQPHFGFETRLGNKSSVEASTRFVAIEGNEAVAIRIGILFGI